MFLVLPFKMELTLTANSLLARMEFFLSRVEPIYFGRAIESRKAKGIHKSCLPFKNGIKMWILPNSLLLTLLLSEWPKLLSY